MVVLSGKVKFMPVIIPFCLVPILKLTFKKVSQKTIDKKVIN